MNEIKCLDYSWENLFVILRSMNKYIWYSTMQVVEYYFYYFFGNV